jgi:hypothetical protein
VNAAVLADFVEADGHLVLVCLVIDMAGELVSVEA